MRRIVQVSAMAMALVVGVVAGAAAQPPVAAGPMSRDWKRLRTPNLTVIGNAGNSELRHVALEIERFRLALAGFAPSMRLETPLPTTVVVFSDDRAFTPYKPRQRGRPVDWVAGYFSPLPEQHRIVMSGTGRREITYYVIFHEYTHLLVNQNVRRLPLWLHEGLAEFYSTYAGSEADGRTIIGRPIEWRVATLAATTPVPLPKLTSPAALGELRRDPDSTARFYATAWALTHYLMVGEGGAMRPKLLAFVQACETGQDAGAAFAQVFGADLAPLDRKVQAHILQLRLPAIQLPPPQVDIPLAPEPMLEADAQQVRADLLVRQGAYAEAAPYLTRALEIDKMHVEARLTRARSLLAQDRATDALDLLSAPDLEAAPRFDVALLRGDALRETARYADAVTAYQRAVRAQPEAAAAFYGLSLAQMGSGDKAAAASFSRALALRPGAEWYYGRQLDALRMGIDTYAVSDAVNYIRLQGWQDDSSSYAMLAAALTQRRLKRPDEAAATLKEIAAHRKPDDWIMQIVAFFEGRLTADALIGKAKGDGLITEARAYAGIIASIDGDIETARRHLEWVRTSGRKDYTEYGLALGELKRLARATATP
jgi:tetratricopeptide (TPR) repeat protein